MECYLRIIHQTALARLATLAVCLGLGVLTGCERGNPPKLEESASSETGAKSEDKTQDSVEKPKTGLDVLNRMVAAYQRASSYSDSGKIYLHVKAGDKPFDETADFSVAMERPNKIRLMAYQAKLYCDGRKIQATIDGIANQVLEKSAPPVIEAKVIDIDINLAMAITDNGKPPPPQLFLLFSKKPMDFLLRGAEEPTLEESGKIEDRNCYRVRISWPDGVGVLWIDQKTFLLRRIVFPTDDLRRQMSPNGPVEQISLVADFNDAKLDVAVDSKIFQLSLPETAETVKYFVPPHTAQLLSKKAPDFKFQDLDGKPVTPETLAGKVVVLDFWAMWCPPCQQSLPNLEKVRQRYKDNPNVVFYCVSADAPKVKNSDLIKAFENLKVSLPILRDPDEAVAAFKLGGFPMMFIIDAKGIVQDFESTADPNLVETLPAKLDKVLAGQDIYEEPMKQYQEQLERLKKYSKMMETSMEDPSKTGVIVKEEKLPESKTAKRSLPTAFKLAPLWKCAGLKSPGNLLVVQNGTGPVRLLVIEAWKSVAEVGLDGKVIAVHKLNVADRELIGSLRSAVGADGKRYVVAFFQSQQRCHVLDDNWNLVTSYPEDALKNPHSGIADVELGDLDGDGRLKLYVSYWGVVGVQAASLDGKRLWSNRILSNASSMAFTGPDSKRRCDLVCTNNTGPLVVLDAQGQRRGEILVLDAQSQRRGEIPVPNRVFFWIASADLRGNGQTLWCGRTDVNNGAVGFSTKGEELWSYKLPHGVQQQPIEPIIAGKMTREGPGQWILPGPDGSIHFVSADGKPWDKFNYGVALCGLATVEIDGRPVLVVASPNGLEAWKVE